MSGGRPSGGPWSKADYGWTPFPSGERRVPAQATPERLAEGGRRRAIEARRDRARPRAAVDWHD